MSKLQLTPGKGRPIRVRTDLWATSRTDGLAGVCIYGPGRENEVWVDGQLATLLLQIFEIDPNRGTNAPTPADTETPAPAKKAS